MVLVMNMFQLNVKKKALNASLDKNNVVANEAYELFGDNVVLV